jgi:2-polyprenyl-3-methyl-5-hydroxy-6-metoxy-1,4-benzoquinol methylase
MELARPRGYWASDLEANGYIFDEKSGVWGKEDFNDIKYNDGDLIEENIYQQLLTVEDVSSMSDELTLYCKDWPSTYHFSKKRSNLLRPFAHNFQGAEILEIGSGFGPITRFMAESGGNVLALEGTFRRAKAGRERCRELENVSVIAEKFENFEIVKKFDFITLIGVLEYANLFNQSENPALDLLKRCQTLLKPGGQLLLAIENKLGLKYFAAAPEDHLGVPMFGIEGGYTPQTPQTYGRKELENLLVNAGFSTQEVMIPYPDYKLTQSVLTAGAILDSNFDSSSIWSKAWSTDPQMPNLLNFAPELASIEIMKNGLGVDLANSFLIAAGIDRLRENLIVHGEIGWHYSTDRKNQYCKELIFRRINNSEIEVETRPLAKNKVVSAQEFPISHNFESKRRYFEGTWERIKWQRIINTDGWDIRELANFTYRHFEILCTLDSSFVKPSSWELNSMLPGSWIDKIPANIIENQNVEPKNFDQEWTSNKDLEFGYLIYRKCTQFFALSIWGNERTYGRFTAKSFLVAFYKALGFEISESDLIRYVNLELEFQHEVNGQPLTLRSNLKDFEHAVGDRRVGAHQGGILHTDDQTQINSLTRKVQIAEAQLSAIENSTIWRITGWYRRLATFLKQP